MQTWSSSEKVIEMTLTLFKDLTGGYMSGKVLSKLDAVSFMLANHSPSHYTFLSASSNTRNRTTFYATLARMIFMEDSPAKFVAFVKPLKGILDGIAGASANGTNAAVLRQNVPVETVIGLFRDLYGIAQATVSRRAYMCAPPPFPTPPCTPVSIRPCMLSLLRCFSRVTVLLQLLPLMYGCAASLCGCGAQACCSVKSPPQPGWGGAATSERHTPDPVAERLNECHGAVLPPASHHASADCSIKAADQAMGAVSQRPRHAPRSRSQE